MRAFCNQAVLPLVHVVLRPEQAVGLLGATAAPRVVMSLRFARTGSAGEAIFISASRATDPIIPRISNVFKSVGAIRDTP